MPYSNSDPVYACLRIQNNLPIGQTSTSERIHRVVVNTVGEWNIGDTVKVKETGGAYKFFAYGDAKDLSGNVFLLKADGTTIAATTSGQGTDEVTLTLTEGGPVGEDVQICYRVGLASLYDFMHRDRNNIELDLHSVNISGGDENWQDVFNQVHPWAGASAGLKAAIVLDGQSIQSNPPA